MKLALHFLLVFSLGLILVVSAKVLRNTHATQLDDPALYLYGTGNADPVVREQVIKQLQIFQKGYTERDTTILNQYMEQLFSGTDLLVLGTMPAEIHMGQQEAAELIRADWLYWGDVRFQLDRAKISSADSVAWFSTIGEVEFDLSRFLTLPLRLTGIMVLEDATWKFRQLQFQFDLDSTWILGSLFLISVLLVISIIRLIIFMVKRTKQPPG